MAEYEILILDSNANPAAFVEIQHGEDGEAIRSATRIARGRPFEVWRDITCVYRQRPGQETIRAA
jgi:hypothetical protein